MPSFRVWGPNIDPIYDKPTILMNELLDFRQRNPPILGNSHVLGGSGSEGLRK